MSNSQIKQQLIKFEQVEKDFLTLIQNFKQQVEEAEIASKDCKEAVIFLGDTGSGKSTLVNWLNNAQFEVEKSIYDEDEVTLKMKSDQTQKISIIGEGIKSVTLYPQYFNNQDQKILTIDFPGFKDTRGWQEQLIIKMMYMDVVKRLDTKFVIVVEQPTCKFQSRGASLQELVNTTFQPQDCAQIDSICLILNQFGEGEKKFETLKTRILSDLESMKRNLNKDKRAQYVYEAFQKNIQIVGKINNEEDFKRIFSDENRKQLWQAIKSTQKIQINCQKLEQSWNIGEYLLVMSDEYLKDILNFLNKTWTQKVIVEYNFQILKQMIEKLEIKIKENADFKYFKEIPNFLDELCKISNTNTSQDIQKIQKDYQSFFELFQFFERYKEFIQGYKSFEEYTKQIQQYFTFTKTSLESQNEKLKLIQEHNEQQAKLQKEKQLLEKETNNIKEECAIAKQQQIKIQQDVIEKYRSQIEKAQDMFKEQVKQNQEQTKEMHQQWKQQQEEQQTKKLLRQAENEINMILKSIIEIQYDWAKYDEAELEKYMAQITEIVTKNKLQFNIDIMKNQIIVQKEDDQNKEIKQQEELEKKIMKKRQKQEDKKRLEEFNKKLQEEDKKRQEEFNKKLEEDKKRQEELIKKLQEEDKKRQEELTKKEKESIKSKIEELFVQLDQLEESFRIQNKKSYIFTYKCTTSEEQQAYNLKTNIQHACQSVLISEQIYRERLDSLTRLISKYK